MTTSVLMTHTRGYVSDNDLQVIRDFALEAPWEWRVALEGLVQAAVEFDKVADEAEKAKTNERELTEAHRDLERKHAQLKKKIENAIGKMRRHIDKLQEGRRNNNLTKGELDTITAGLQTGFDALAEEVEASPEHTASPRPPG